MVTVLLLRFRDTTMFSRTVELEPSEAGIVRTTMSSSCTPSRGTTTVVVRALAGRIKEGDVAGIFRTVTTSLAEEEGAGTFEKRTDRVGAAVATRDSLGVGVAVPLMVRTVIVSFGVSAAVAATELCEL